MSAQPEIAAPLAGDAHHRAEANGRPSAVILPWRPIDAKGRELVGETSGGSLGPAYGLLLGLGLGAILWLGIGLLGWEVFGH